jgi:hypothetical protein
MAWALLDIASETTYKGPLMNIKLLISAITLVAGSIEGAIAGVISVADLSISHLLLVDPTTQMPSPLASQIRYSSEARTGTANSIFSGIKGAGMGPSSATDVQLNGNAASVDVAYRCAGPSCGNVAAIYGGSAENNSSTHLRMPSGNFSLGDMFVAGNFLTDGMSGLTRADTSLGYPASGGANATILNGTSLQSTFSTRTSVDLQFLLTYEAFVLAYLDRMPSETGWAAAAIGWNLTLTDVTPNVNELILSWAPNELNFGFLSNESGNNGMFESKDTIFSQPFTLQADHRYSLILNQVSNSTGTLEVTEVAEPRPLFLIMLGLLGMGACLGRRRHSSSALASAQHKCWRLVSCVRNTQTKSCDARRDSVG